MVSTTKTVQENTYRIACNHIPFTSKNIKLISNDIVKAASILKNSRIIGLPTETVYGLAGNIYSEHAIRHIFEIKKRPFFNPIIVHIKSLTFLSKVARDIPKEAIKLAETFWPGPLTLLLNKQSSIPDLITGGKSTVAVRVPNHPVALSILNLLDFPLAAPSANPFGSISPTCAEHVDGYFKEELEMILDGGVCKSGIESTIIGFQNQKPVLYRHGAIPLNMIEMVIGKTTIATKNNHPPQAPGMLSKHYAPSTNTVLTSDAKTIISIHVNKKIGLLLFKSEINQAGIYRQEVLSKTGNLQEAASNLYAALHRLDKANLDIIIVERVPETGLGNSINDRLERAATKAC